MTMNLSDAETTKLRFRVGDRVECSISDSWICGTVSQLFYTQDSFPKGTCMPFQVALDDGRLIFARRDHDSVIRALLHEPEPKPSLLPRPENRVALLRAFRSTLTNVACAWTLMQFGEYFSTGSVSYTMKFVDAELVAGGHELSLISLGVASLAALVLVAGQSVMFGKADNPWLLRDGATTRSGKADSPSILLLSTLVAIGQETLYRGALPTLASKVRPENVNATTAGLIASIVLYLFRHPPQHASFAGFAGFWFAIASYYGGVQAAMFASLFAQLASSIFFFKLDRASAEEAGAAADEKGWWGIPAPRPATAVEGEHAAPVQEPPEPKAEPPRVEPPPEAPSDSYSGSYLDSYFLPVPENRKMILRSLRGNGVCVLGACLLLQALEYYTTGETKLLATFDGVDLELLGNGSWLRTFGVGMAGCFAVVSGIDVFSARSSSGYLADSATAWLNGARIVTKSGKPDRAAILMNALLTGLGHEILFRGALPALACKLVHAKMLPSPPPGHDTLAYGLIASIAAYFAFHPAEFAFFAAFASFWYAIAAYCGGLGAAVLASAASRVGASSLYFYAMRRNRATGKAALRGNDGAAGPGADGKKAKAEEARVRVGSASMAALKQAKKSSKKQR